MRLKEWLAILISCLALVARKGGLAEAATRRLVIGKTADYAGACHRAALGADPFGSPPCEPTSNG